MTVVAMVVLGVLLEQDKGLQIRERVRVAVLIHNTDVRLLQVLLPLLPRLDLARCGPLVGPMEREGPAARRLPNVGFV